MSRFGRKGRVFFVEEPIRSDGERRIEVSERGDGVYLCRPMLENTDLASVDIAMPELIGEMALEQRIHDYVAWHYTPMMIGWKSLLPPPVAVVYDCMDELTGFKNAPPELLPRERELFATADLVFTGGQSLYEAKREQHDAVYAFPSSIDVGHFAQAMEIGEEVPDQTAIGHPRIGFAGVIDERMDLTLLAAAAELRPDLQFVMVGPVVKIGEDALPRRENIHYLGQRRYEDLPALMAGWDVGMMPFALNESTRFISPTKTPEYLAAGLPVVSTPITDVVRPYGQLGLAHIASTSDEFVKAIDATINEDAERRRSRVREFLSTSSWDTTFEAMLALITAAVWDRSLAQEPADAAETRGVETSSLVSTQSGS
ncbi:MAG TPA: glycosyltransferase [Pyrinomonadaceae bacterium]|nr:glycosyltransferase [Pyrinomonadaceae bacterium]